MKIRVASKTDIQSIVNIWKEMMNFHIERDHYFEIAEDGPERFREFIEANLASNNYRILVSEYDGKVIGYCLAKKNIYPPVFKIKDYGEITDLSIIKEFRRKGLGEALLNEILTWYSNQGIKRIECRVARSNEVSTNFWRKMGFKCCMEILYIDK